MNQIKLLKDFPNLPAGTLLTQGADGVYRDLNNLVFLSQQYIDANPLIVQSTTPIAVGTSYFYVDDMGLVQQALFDNKGQTRKDYGNYFLTSQSALNAVPKLSVLLQQLSLPVPIITVTPSLN